MSEQLIAGATSVVITPRVGVDLCGFGGRPGPSTGVHDDLMAKALFLEAGQSAILITADLIGIDDESLRFVRERVEAETDVPGANVMITCSHTHSGPATPCISYLGKWDAEYMDELRMRLTEAAIEAWRARGPAKWAAARAPVQIGTNRRVARNGQIAMEPNEEGVTSKYADALRIDTAAGAPLAVWMCHAAHAVVMGGDNLLISADWPGYAQRAVEQAHPGAVGLFAQGCCGNINCNWRNGWELAENLGVMLAEAVGGAVDATDPVAQARVTVASETVALPLQDPPPVEDARAALAEAVRSRDEGWENANYGWRMMLDGIVTWSEQILALAERGAADLTIDYEVQAIRLSDFCIVGLPGEVFVEYSLNIDATAPCRLTAVPAYTNGNPGYVPTAAAYPEGGYEVLSAIRWYGTTMLAPETEEVILAAASRVLAKV